MKRKGKPVLDASAALSLLAKLIREGVPVREAIAALRALHVPAVAFDPIDAERSARYAAKGISLGDRCFLATTLQGEGWTSDRELAQLVDGPPPLRYFR